MANKATGSGNSEVANVYGERADELKVQMERIALKAVALRTRGQNNNDGSEQNLIQKKKLLMRSNKKHSDAFNKAELVSTQSLRLLLTLKKLSKKAKTETKINITFIQHWMFFQRTRERALAKQAQPNVHV